jgi:Zn ribbon nucleic-acid-binding protein
VNVALLVEAGVFGPSLESLLQLLNKWPKWKRIAGSPDNIDALEKRVAAVENRLRRAPGEGCPRCGALEFRVDWETAVIRAMKCGACGFSRERGHLTAEQAGRALQKPRQGAAPDAA